MVKIFHSLVIIIIVGALTSCVKDNYPAEPGHGPQATISISAGTGVNDTRGYDSDPYGDPEDRIIQEFRTLIFEDDGKFYDNLYIPNLASDNPFTISILTGTYHFVFIANEGSDPTLAAKLASFSGTITQLEGLGFSHSAFSSSKNIPMAHVERGVEIRADNTYIVGGSPRSGTWPVSLTRLGVRMDVRIFTESPGKQSDFESLQIYNIPKEVPIFDTDGAGNPIYNGGASNSEVLTITKTQGDNGGFQTVTGGYEWIKSRIIIPSSLFSPDSEAEAVSVRVVYSGGETSAAPLAPEKTGKYQLVRNIYMMARINIMQSFEVYLDVLDWEDADLENLLAGQKNSLNVSAFTATVNERNRVRIWFWSDQPEVYIDEVGSSGTPVNNIFNDLAGRNAANLHYTYDPATKQGVGYMDVMTDRSKIPVGNAKTETVYLNAGGLRRAITITGTVGDTSIGYFDYVGAFWRNNQMGERLISGRSYNSWVAEIVDGQEWFKLGAGKSMDPNVWTTRTPGDPEDYPVEGDLKSVSGSGFVFFRVGVNSVNDSGTPRYGRVKLTGGGTVWYIYLRQGEDADYLLRPEDRGTNPQEDSWDDGSGYHRPLSAKFAPYNLTSQALYNNTNTSSTSPSSYPTVAAGKGVFTEYPTQAGGFFFWAQEKTPVTSFHPTLPLGGFSSSNWSSALGTVNQYWDSYKNAQETCPEGYRRPTNGPTHDRESSVSNKNSEMKQSLWTNPRGISSSSTTENANFGYYADGFFDRRIVYDATGTTTSTFNKESAVHPNESIVGYAGVLFFNPNTESNASLFFPTPGMRQNNGAMFNTGRQAQYWTGSCSGNTSAYTLHITSPTEVSNRISMAGTFLNVLAVTRTYALNIRCVAK